MNAKIPLAGGHSIDCPEPVFGLAVTGRVDLLNLKRNGGAREGASLFLSKPLGVGILTTAQKKGKSKSNDIQLAIDSMCTLNKVGQLYGSLDYVEAMTDVTGFGLLGHLLEICEASNVSAKIYFDKVPQLDKQILKKYIDADCIPGGTNRNWESYGHKIASMTDHQKYILCDPQTSGGLLVAVKKGNEKAFISLNQELNLMLQSIGIITKRDKPLITIY